MLRQSRHHGRRRASPELALPIGPRVAPTTLANVVVDVETSFTRLVGCRAPIQLAVMGGGTGTPQLAAAVSDAGGLGMLSSTFPMPVADQLSLDTGPNGPADRRGVFRLRPRITC